MNSWTDRWVGSWFLLTTSLVVSLAVNHLRCLPIRPWVVYVPKKTITTVDYLSALKFSPTYIDARTPAEFQQGHVPGAVNLTRADVVERGLRPPTKRGPFVVYCRPLCAVAQRVGEALEREGYSPIYVLEGGFESWKGGIQVALK